MKGLTAAAVMLLASCSSTSFVEEADYACMTGTIEGTFTSTTLFVRGVKIPNSDMFDIEMVQILCGER
jgi:hypothetical protein